MRLSIGKSDFVLHRGCLHALAAQDEQLIDALLWRSVMDNCAAEQRTAVVCTTDAATSLALSGLQAMAGEATTKGLLQIFELQPAPQGPGGLSTLMMDLHHWQVANASLLVIEGAQDLLPRLDEALLRQWHEWALDHNQAILFLFRSDGMGKNDPMTQLLPLSHHFSGLARISTRHGDSTWENFHWFGPSGLLPPHTSALSGDKAHPFSLSEKVELVPASLAPAVDDIHVFAQQSILQPGELPAEGWQYMDANLDGVVLQTTKAVAATIVLAYLPDTDFYRLARAIFILRKRNGVRLKIVVREINSRLRYGRERQAIKLGANLVVPAELSYSRFLTLVTMVESQIFQRKLPATFSEAMSDSSPTDEMGYLPPQEFARAVTAMLTQSEAMKIQNALIQLPVASGLQTLDALRYCKLNRPGDICTADQRHLYLFLSACRKADVSRVMSRSFGLPIDSLFSAEDRFHSTQRISAVIQALAAQIRLAQLPDYSADLFDPAAVPTSGKTLKVTSQVVRGQTSEQFSPPPAAVPRPLVVKDTRTGDRRAKDRRNGGAP